MSEEVRVQRDGKTSVIVINRPEARNALTRGVVDALAKAFDAATADADVRCVVLTGEGGHFCAGADLRRTMMEDPDMMSHLEEYMDAFHAVVRALVRCPKPTIASLDGAAVGFGADLALACDLRVAATTAYVQEKFVGIGLMPDGGGTFWLPRLVGTARARSKARATVIGPCQRCMQKPANARLKLWRGASCRPFSVSACRPGCGRRWPSRAFRSRSPDH